MVQKASTRGMRFLNFSQDFGSGFYTEREENTSTESIIFKCASVVVPQSKDALSPGSPLRIRFEQRDSCSHVEHRSSAIPAVRNKEVIAVSTRTRAIADQERNTS